MDEQLTFEFAERTTIKGFPELRWTGKRPYRSTQYYPAQLRERYGEERDGWINKIFWGDNLQVMSHLLKEYRGKIDLVYIDPPFDSKADYKRKIALKGIGNTTSDATSFEEKQYGDIWTNDEYLQFMYERLMILRELMSDTASIFVHCDWHKVHHLRCLMDEIFGSNMFLNEIVWQRTRAAHSDATYFGKVHDTILVYKKGGQAKFNPLYTEHSEAYLKRFTKEENGRKYMLVPLHGPGQGVARNFFGKIIAPPAGRCWPVQSKIDELIAQNRVELTSNGTPSKKSYLDENNGNPVSDWWDDIVPLNPVASERTDYPTQKPEQLLERIVEAATNRGDLVFDCFMGSGTTQSVAMKLGRRFIGADINLGAIQTTTKRLINVASELDGQLQEEIKYTGFEVYNVNNYDFFRNPIEAKNLIIEALEVQPFTQGNVWDGELDGRMVKIMPVNRIATKADLEELKANLPYKTYEKRKEENPRQPVELITIICMGHEPDLKASLEQSLSEYKVDVQIVDILRDKSELQLKREAEAEVVREGNKLVIRSFYPMNLMQKLSLQKEYVEDWKQLVEQKNEDVDVILLKEPKDSGYYEFSADENLVIEKDHNSFTPEEIKKSFHADTYCFDSKPEKECFLQYISSKKVKEIYFTGMFTANQGDLFVQYYDPESKRIRQYYPDFLAKMNDGSYQLIEVKGDNMIDDEVVKAKAEAAEEMSVASGMKYVMYAGSVLMKQNVLEHPPVTYSEEPSPLLMVAEDPVPYGK